MFSHGKPHRISTLFIKNKKHQLNLKTRKTNIFSGKKVKMGYTKMVINFSDYWKLVLLSTPVGKLVIYLYGDVYYFKLSIGKNKTYVNFDKNTKSVCIYTMCDDNFYRTYWSFFKKTLSSFNVPFFKKIKFKGKGYYIFKNFRQTITPQFGHSHRLYVYSYFASVIFLSKTSIFIFGLTDKDIIKVGDLIKAMRPISIYTGRGVRFTRQILYKKLGKVSTYR
jgi:ribosomal protein L6P/L9E